MSKRIENEEQYNKSLAWLVEKAEEIENPHPLASQDDKDRLMNTYNFVEKMVQDYNAEFYKDKYYPPLNEPEPGPEEQQKEEVDLSAWLDE
jgi:hypothetical protein